MLNVTAISTSLRHGLRRFAKDTEGYTTVEVAIILPTLFTLFAASWIYFDVFRQQAVGQKANFAIGDMLSRETDELNDAYIDNTYKMLALLTHTGTEPVSRTISTTVTDTDGLESVQTETISAYDISMRITVVKNVLYADGSNALAVKWSEARGGMIPMSNSNLSSNYAARIPEMQSGDEVILVETSEHWTPALRIVGLRNSAPGLGEMELTTYSFTRPRYTNQVSWEGLDEGLYIDALVSDSTSAEGNIDGTDNNEATSDYPDRDHRG
ncbi:hypothetical protein Q4543_07700 [Salipiger sp. 1_MG-2023]|uniref:TadE/TadG family type IV pilus assembly protein n=1 Tax=Salipiger sp. 1_MG-2023 TaxID=3062665 RepID=UPI0026E18033|nr:hypothetical protein [Salipiger sp. 1_MG-2023]MDO6585399.1 hypothetical protein [Salipiger sp. 1_MG-2023]